ncbi:LL-diaminopimelate aminotransferase [Thermogemmatispora tikiterensis]|uniref:Aminotransferase n=1 Tax=Thermogemmatispora tikiterensis TaxID=1825093 RepID=A0A328VHM0_9CHLR|nr:LL-diaminopimelate aminotransferase [Thermogemmatispora tikiterensis]
MISLANAKGEPSVQLSRLVQSLPPYHFAETQKKLAARQAAGVDVINLSMGDPDLPAPSTVIERLCQAAHDPENHRYPEYRGLRALHEAFVAWFQRRFGVTLTPEEETLPLLGSKEGLAYVAAAVLNPGDVALVPDPNYTVYVTGTTSIGAHPYLLPLRESHDYLPDLESIPSPVLQQARLLWLNYPNNPTAACADQAFFERAVAFARRHDLLIVHDMAYAEVYFEQRPPSILEIPGAREVAVELHSLSKTYNMAGFRVGWLVGNREVVDAVGRLKSNIDSGMFRPIQHAAIAALQLPDSWIQERNAVYRRRRDLLVAGCNSLGLRARQTQAGLYVWAAVPEGFKARDFASWLFDQTGVLLTPGSNFGAAGEGYLRISMTAPEERIEAALQRMKTALRELPRP